MKFERAKIAVRGAVQGVGFRPFVYRLAVESHLFGWVLNSSQGVFIEVEGPQVELQSFLLRLEREKPPRSSIQSLECSFLEPVGYDRFEIRYSKATGEKSVFILPDIAVCEDCLRELFDPANRRYRYPFTNCTNCGPRFTIIESLPYDRPNTSMKRFSMCSACLREYHHPGDRRFHAQPNACPVCGPRLRLWDAGGIEMAQGDDALLGAVELVRQGKLVALKGIGGFQLLVNARNGPAVRRLRERKRREEKPFAVMYPTLDLVRQDCMVSDLEARLLAAPEAPIVLLRRRPGHSLLDFQIAPRNTNLGVMIPYSPLHHLLMSELGTPVVATSGNLSDEPICIDEYDALERLRGIADHFLIHDRPIIRHVDDSVARVVGEREMVMRRARGYAPLPIQAKAELPCILAVGAHLKNSIALSIGQAVFISQHIGDLETSEAFSAFRRAIADLPRLYEAQPSAIACDMHPEYLSTKHAAEMQVPVHRIQHHYAHVLACMAENDLVDPVLGVSWDGTGYGNDGTIWGGEFLVTGHGSFRRIAHFRQFRLPGSTAAVKEPCRTAAGVLYEIWGDRVLADRRLAPVAAFSTGELSIVRRMLCKRLNAPITSSVGRLFDATASILGLRQRVTFEGQAAMELECAVEPGVDDYYPFEFSDRSPFVVDWAPMITQILNDMQKGEGSGQIAAKFHNTLAAIVLAVAQKVGEKRVVLTGGCFQNRYLVERSADRLRAAGFEAYWHQRIPPNDGGIALGQVIAVARCSSVAKRAEGVAA
jgi:hydrogenase maturation protein HypF